ncbi:hypothetical protein I5860_010010, partial [Clostridioides difficile]
LRSVSIWVFNLQGTNQVTCFRIYRETLSRFSCAASTINNFYFRNLYLNNQVESEILKKLI